MKISAEVHQKKLAFFAGMETEREPFKNIWRDLADYILPTRYTWLLSDTERRQKMTRNPNIIDATATKAARVLASGMLNGITSPSRPWFRLRLKNTHPAMNSRQPSLGTGGPGDENPYARRWLDEVERRMLITMGETNFYNALAVMYLDLVIFGTSAVLIYEDYNSVFRCYNASLGEYYLANGANGMVSTFARKFNYTVAQCVERFGLENVPDTVKAMWNGGGANRLKTIEVWHLIEPNEGLVPRSFAVQELYWIKGCADGGVASVRGYNELPGIFPRWEISGVDSYGSCPGMDALGDTIQLQHEQKRKGQSLDYMLKPPSVADIQLANRPTALIPGGMTYVAGVNNVGVKPIYTVNPPIGELTLDIRDVQLRIKEFFHNDLFKMISDLETVRTATEIDARREEKLVQLGPVLERFENEALDPAISRIYAIMQRANLLPPPPQGLEGTELEIQYVSILSSAQSAVGVAPLERWLQLVGNIAALNPAVVNIPNWDDLIRDYGRDIGVKEKHISTREEVAERTRAQEEMRQGAAGMEQLTQGAKAAELLSKTDVGGGVNALQQMLSP